MRARPALSALVTLASLTLAAPAAAQGGGQAVAPAGAAVLPWDAKPVGTYDLKVQTPERIVGVTLVIADSAGALVATMQQDNDPQARPMTIAIKGADLTLATDAPRGRLTVVMQREAERVFGRWTIGDTQSGTFEGKKRP